MDRSASGRPSIDIGMPPRPIADTARLPIVRWCILLFLPLVPTATVVA
jgi:hypothetical protein